MPDQTLWRSTIQNHQVELQVDQVEGTALIISVTGRIDGVNAQEFYNNLNKEIDGSDNPVVLDLENLSYISSAGLRSILLIAKTLKGKNTRFMLCSLPEPIKEIVEIAGFDKIIDVLQSRTAAVDAIKG